MNDEAITVRIKRLQPGFEDIPLPAYATEGSAGMDLRAAVEEPITLHPGDIAAVPTNLAVELPAGFEAQVRPRSGLALNHGITLPNAPGTIDADYRGEIKVIMANIGREPFVIRRGERIAQFVVGRYSTVLWDEAHELNHTARGAGGFGHSGKQ